MIILTKDGVINMGQSRYAYVSFTGNIGREYGTWYLTAKQTWTKDINMAFKYERHIAEKLANDYNASVI